MNGKLLTAEQSARLAILQSVDKDRAVELIAAHLRDAAQASNWNRHGNTPRHWYSRNARRVSDRSAI